MINYLKKLFSTRRITITLHRDATESSLTITEKFHFKKNQNKSIIVDRFVAQNYPEWAVISHS